MSRAGQTVSMEHVALILYFQKSFSRTDQQPIVCALFPFLLLPFCLHANDDCVTMLAIIVDGTLSTTSSVVIEFDFPRTFPECGVTLITQTVKPRIV